VSVYSIQSSARPHDRRVGRSEVCGRLPACRRAAERRFSSTAMADAYLRLYHQVLASA
jgi:hypothetical protein